jgi:hypothetical protein
MPLPSGLMRTLVIIKSKSTTECFVIIIEILAFKSSFFCLLLPESGQLFLSKTFLITLVNSVSKILGFPLY